MKILLYNPDNGVTQNFMPHLWMFLLQALTPSGHEVVLIDGNTQPMSDAELVQFVLDKQVGLVGIGAMTRMVAKAYRVADAIRAAGIPVVMGGPHVTEAPDEALGRNGGPRHADALALGEADHTWPRIVEDAARGELKEVYAPVDAFGQERKPTLQDYPAIPWDSIDLRQFNRIPGFFRLLMRRFGFEWETFHIIPIESGRGCPYGCDFCTVTGFFGDSIRFRTNRSIVDEMLKIKARARSTRGQAAIFFVDDNFAINVKRTKALLRDVIAAGAEMSWVGQISANLLRDEELLDLIAASGGRWIFIGMESLDPANLASKASVADTVRLPYIFIAAGLLILGLAVAFSHLPAVTRTESFRPSKDGGDLLSRSIWSFRHTVLGALGIFFYVGVEVGLASIAVNYFKTQGVDSTKTASFLVSLYWFGALVGRLLGSWILTKIRSGKLLGIFGFAAAALIALSMVTSGQVAIWTLVLCGFFNSIMFPNIFTLGIAGLGPMTSKGSGLIMSAVVGGAVIPYLLGALADKVGIQHAFVLPIFCYLFIAYYGLWGSKPAQTAAE